MFALKLKYSFVTKLFGMYTQVRLHTHIMPQNSYRVWQHKPFLTEPVKWMWRTDINYTITKHHVLRKTHGHKRFN